MRKLAAKILIFLVIFGVSFSNIPFYVLTGAFDAHMKAHNIVDKAWHLSQDSNVVDKFTSYRNLIEKIKVYEARAATIEFVGGASASGINAAYNMSLTALTGGIASAPAQGDIVIVINMIANTTNGNPGVGTAGYTEIADLYRGNDTYDTNLSTNYKVMSASPDTTASCNPSSGSSIASDCVAMVFRGVDNATPLDVTSTSAVGNNAEDVNCLAITPVTSGAVVVCTGGAAGASVDTTPTAPTGYSGSTYVQTDPGSAGAAVASYKNWTSGAEDPAAYVMDLGTASANSWAAITLALRPTNSPPTLTVTQPDGTGDTVTVGDSYNVTYRLFDSDNIVTAAMYYDTDDTGLNGTAITGACATAAEGPDAVTDVTCSWDTTGMTPGNYYVYGTTTDGVNPGVSDYSPPGGVITINAPSYTVTVGASGSQDANADSGATDIYFNGKFTYSIDAGSDTVTSITVSNNGNGGNLSNVRLYYDNGGGYGGGDDTLFGTSTLGSAISGSMSVASGTTRSVYVVANIPNTVVGGQTVDLRLTATAVSGGSTITGTPADITSLTTIRPNVTSITYPITSPLNGARIGQSITINGAGFGTTCDGTNNRVTVGGAGNVVSCTGTTFSNTSISITNFQYSSGDSYGGATSLLVRAGGTDDNASWDFYVYPDVTSVSVSEGKEGDTIATISGNHFGTGQGADGVKFDDGTLRTATVNGTWSTTSITNVVIPSAISDSVDSVTIRVYQGTGGNNSLSGDYSASFTILPKITGIIDDFAYADDTAREYDASDNAANNNTADLKDGEIQIDGNHFGAAGAVTILGQTATQAVVGTRCSSSSYTATCITVQVPTSTSDILYTGNIVVTRTSDTKTDTLPIRILPRITANNPNNGIGGDTIQITGNHLCQSGTCPVSPNRSSASDNVKFGSTQALDGDFQNLTGAGTCAGAGAAWTDTEICVKVPAGISAGSQPTQLTSTASAIAYTSNAKAFTINTSIPNDPSVSGNRQYKSDNATVISAGGATNESTIILKADISASISINMALQVEVKPTGTAFACGAGNCADAVEGTVIGGGACASCTSLANAKVTISGLSDGQKHWQARVRNTTTNEYSGWISFGTHPDSVFEIDFIVDTTTPTITFAPTDTCAGGQSNLDSNGVTISWDINELADGQIEYSTNINLTNSTNFPSTPRTAALAHTVELSNLNSGTTYYYKVKSRDNASNLANRPSSEPYCSFNTDGVTDGPAKTAVFHIAGATGAISSSTDYPFAAPIPEDATTTKSAFVEITGVYLSSSASSKDIGINFNSQGLRTYVVPVPTTPTISFFKFIHPVNSVNPNNILTVAPQANTTVYVTSARLIVNYAYTP